MVMGYAHHGCTYTWCDILIMHTKLSNCCSYHGLKANGSQLGNLLHDKICFIDKMDLLSLVPVKTRVSNNGNNEANTNKNLGGIRDM